MLKSSDGQMAKSNRNLNRIRVDNLIQSNMMLFR